MWLPAFQALGADIMAVLHTIEVNFLDGCIGVLDSGVQIRARGCYAENSSTSRQEIGRRVFCSGLKYDCTAGIDSPDGITLARRPRISVGGEHYTNRWVRAPLQINTLEFAVDGGGEDSAEIGVQAVQ